MHVYISIIQYKSDSLMYYNLDFHKFLSKTTPLLWINNNNRLWESRDKNKQNKYELLVDSARLYCYVLCSEAPIN